MHCHSTHRTTHTCDPRVGCNSLADASQPLAALCAHLVSHCCCLCSAATVRPKSTLAVPLATLCLIVCICSNHPRQVWFDLVSCTSALHCATAASARCAHCSAQVRPDASPTLLLHHFCTAPRLPRHGCIVPCERAGPKASRSLASHLSNRCVARQSNLQLVCTAQHLCSSAAGRRNTLTSSPPAPDTILCARRIGGRKNSRVQRTHSQARSSTGGRDKRKKRAAQRPEQLLPKFKRRWLSRIVTHLVTCNEFAQQTASAATWVDKGRSTG